MIITWNCDSALCLVSCLDPLSRLGTRLLYALTFPSSVAEVNLRRKSLWVGSEAYSASSLNTFVRGEEVIST